MSSIRDEIARRVEKRFGEMFTTTAALYLIRLWRQHGELPPGEVAWDRRPGVLGRFLLFPLNQHRHTEKHRYPDRPWYRL